MLENLLNLNTLDSQSLEEVKHYITAARWNKKEIQEYQFFGSGEEENLDKWKHGHFTYRLVHYGFRMDKLPIDSDIGAFGCSYTFGQGLPSYMLWHELLAKNMNMSSLNFGICGASIPTILDIFNIVTKHVKLKHAVMLLPSVHRVQIAKIHEDMGLAFLNCNPNHDSIFNQTYDFNEKEIWKIMPDEEIYKQMKNALFQSEMLAKSRNIKMYISSWDDHTYQLLKKINFKYIKLLPVWYSRQDIINDKARDNRHPGPFHHSFFAEQILPTIQSCS